MQTACCAGTLKVTGAQETHTGRTAGCVMSAASMYAGYGGLQPGPSSCSRLARPRGTSEMAMLAAMCMMAVERSRGGYARV